MWMWVVVALVWAVLVGLIMLFIYSASKVSEGLDITDEDLDAYDKKPDA